MKTTVYTSKNLNKYLIMGFGWGGMSDFKKHKATKKSNNK